MSDDDTPDVNRDPPEDLQVCVCWGPELDGLQFGQWLAGPGCFVDAAGHLLPEVHDWKPVTPSRLANPGSPGPGDRVNVAVSQQQLRDAVQRLDLAEFFVMGARVLTPREEAEATGRTLYQDPLGPLMPVPLFLPVTTADTETARNAAAAGPGPVLEGSPPPVELIWDRAETDGMVVAVEHAPGCNSRNPSPPVHPCDCGALAGERPRGETAPEHYHRRLRAPEGECGLCDRARKTRDPMEPPHDPSPMCESGARPHCTCDRCY